MNIANIPAGTYVVAVSGGVDSVVLLRLLADLPNLKLIVAHFDHGMRPSSHEDALFVQRLAKAYDFAFTTERIELGENASEAQARQARYAFLRRAQKEVSATAIITAHHQDDLLETAIINLLRGTGWRGLCSLRDMPTLRRPLLAVSKAEVTAYAKAQQLEWREDITNTDTRHLRNAVRHEILPAAGPEFRQELLALIARQGEIREEVDLSFADATRPSTNPDTRPSSDATWSPNASVTASLRSRGDFSVGEPIAVLCSGRAEDRVSFLSRIASQPVTGDPKEGTPNLSSLEEDLGGAFGAGPVAVTSSVFAEEFGDQVASGEGVREADRDRARDCASILLSRASLIVLPKLVAKELLSSTVHRLTGGRVERHMLHRMWLFAKTARPAKTLQISRDLAMTVQKSTVVVHRR